MDARVVEAIDRSLATPGAALVYDLRAIAANMRRFATAARAANITPLFALKSFPLDSVRALAATELAGFDAASSDEVRAAASARSDGVLSVFDPGAQAIAHVPRDARRVIVSCETVEQVRAAPAHADLALRISASVTGRDPAIGAILDGTGHRRSRFGVSTREEIAALTSAAGSRRYGLHVHHGPVTATNADRFVATARAALALLDREPAFINLGGAWHGIEDIGGAFAAIRAALGPIEIFVEPGRALAANAGFACGRVLSTRETHERILSVTELSRVCHLRWSQPELVVPAPRADARRKIVLVGPTCYEEDVIGEWIADPRDVTERVVLRGISGYALAWNTSFAGVPAARVIAIA